MKSTDSTGPSKQKETKVVSTLAVGLRHEKLMNEAMRNAQNNRTSSLLSVIEVKSNQIPIKLFATTPAKGTLDYEEYLDTVILSVRVAPKRRNELKCMTTMFSSETWFNVRKA